VPLISARRERDMNLKCRARHRMIFRLRLKLKGHHAHPGCGIPTRLLKRGMMKTRCEYFTFHLLADLCTFTLAVSVHCEPTDIERLYVSIVHVLSHSNVLAPGSIRGTIKIRGRLGLRTSKMLSSLFSIEIVSLKRLLISLHCDGPLQLLKRLDHSSADPL